MTPPTTDPVPPSRIDPREVVDLAATRNEVFAEWKKGIDARLTDGRRRREELTAEFAEARFSATSRDQLATVTVGAGGVLQSVQIGERGRSATPVQIGAAVLAAYRVAAMQATEESISVIERMAGPEQAAVARELLPQFDGADEDV